jgi:hypothetical protein
LKMITEPRAYETPQARGGEYAPASTLS